MNLRAAESPMPTLTELHRRAPATVRVTGPNTISVKGCVISGIVCKSQRWTRVG